MPASIQVGITGGIGSGKSTVAMIFTCLGIPVYDADSHAKGVMTTDGILIEQIKKEFGNLTYDAAGRLDRKYLADRVFSDAERLKKLNNIVHPRVAIDYKEWISRQSARYIVKEAALLFESGSARELDKIIVVTAPEAIRIKRVMNRDHRSASQVQNIIQQQMPEKQIIEQADYVIVNDENTAVVPQVLKLNGIFLAMK